MLRRHSSRFQKYPYQAGLNYHLRLDCCELGTQVERTTGGKAKLPGISKRGNVYLRKFLIHGALVAMLRIAYDAP